MCNGEADIHVPTQQLRFLGIDLPSHHSVDNNNVRFTCICIWQSQ